MKRSTEGNDGRPNKKAKRKSAQRIVAQNGDLSLAPGGRLDVPAFVKARSYESGQMENSMEKSRKSRAKRAFQTPPRSLRRRTASHNPERVPKKLRARAKAEAANDKTPPIMADKKKPRGHARVKAMAEERAHQRAKDENHDDDFLKSVDHTGINELASAPQGGVRFQRRQKNKNWLPTHVWHAKRAHMVSRWGFAIPETPTEKCYRPTHRASTMDGAIAWDASYYGSLVFHGNVEKIVHALSGIGAPSAALERYKRANRAWEGLLVIGEEYIGPAVIYWSKQMDNEETRTVFVRVHPDIYERIFDTAKASCDGDSNAFTLHDCRYSIGSIDITGPRSLLALRTVLNPTKGEGEVKDEKTERWKDLATLTNPSSLPESVAITLEVNDPRLYPPKSFKPSASRNSPEFIASSWPEAMTSASRLFTIEGRKESYNFQSSLKRINERRTTNDPAKPLPVLPEDPQIPVVIIKRRDNSWTLLLPWGWALPFWHNLMQVNHVRLGGLEQRHQLAYEVGRLHFPDDYFFTKSGISQAKETAAKLKQAWESKPRGKRPEYASLGEIGDPFKPDWKLVETTFSEEDGKTILSPQKISPVRLRYSGRGNPNYAARIYADEEQKQLIGFVTSGSYNLSIGYGFAIGGVLTSHFNNNKALPIVFIRCLGEKLLRRAQCEQIDLCLA